MERYESRKNARIDYAEIKAFILKVLRSRNKMQNVKSATKPLSSKEYEDSPTTIGETPSSP